MKKKFLLPLISASLMLGAFTACSDDSSSSPDQSVIENPDVNPPAENPGDVTPPAENPGDVTPPVENPGDVTPPVENPDVNPPVENPGDVPPPAENPGEVTPPASGEAVRVEIQNSFPANETVGTYDSAYKYYGAELTGKDQFTYGRFEARMKMVAIPGSVSSMFLYYDPSWELGDEPWNEIDIEVLGKNSGEWQSNLITREPDLVNEDGTTKKKAKQYSEFVTGFGFDATEDFHLYAMIWTPEYISWEIDSVEVRRDVIGMPLKPNKHDQVAFMTEQQSLRFNLWASKSTSWVGKFTGAELAEGPKEQLIDYVRVYNYDVATKTFTLDWQDDFEGSELDKTRWSAGDWDMEHVKLNKANVVVEDGYCKLRMTRELKSAETAD